MCVCVCVFVRACGTLVDATGESFSYLLYHHLMVLHNYQHNKVREIQRTVRKMHEKKIICNLQRSGH